MMAVRLSQLTFDSMNPEQFQVFDRGVWYSALHSSVYALCHCRPDIATKCVYVFCCCIIRPMCVDRYSGQASSPLTLTCKKLLCTLTLLWLWSMDAVFTGVFVLLQHVVGALLTKSMTLYSFWLILLTRSRTNIINNYSLCQTIRQAVHWPMPKPLAMQ